MVRGGTEKCTELQKGYNSSTSYGVAGRYFDDAQRGGLVAGT